ncbi:HTH-type transcriptional regulator HdfR [Paraburkholderia caffeinitolerans]|uniref:HTH-type transcriptional regulator HdfR n=1 Tax=Paraburkholderia caffeinitolerans TaxID=1723730 RepID=A0A6J5GBU5_9BURK|nr:LysR family transcriptional regulator [Paraburkholderia caffeinitolerans]CAB3797691.1 HTH-type transcriptional regulator HdfR [Paraburkholderia caffeinitolerans]
MHEINSRRLMHLVALAEEGSFARAAARAHLSQSAFSRSIQALEDDLGIKLFDRAARGIAMTAAGNLMVGRARRVLFETRCLFRDLELLKAHEFGEVRVGVGPYVAAVLLPRLIVEFSRRFPKVKLAVEVGEADTLLARLRTEQLDALVVDRRLQSIAPDVALQRLERHEGAWYVRAGHPLIARGEVPLSALREFPLVSVPMPAFMKDALHRLLKIRSHEQIPLQTECNDVSVLRAVVAESDAVFFATRSSVRADLEAGRLANIVLASPPRLTLDFALVHLAERTPSPAALATMELAGMLMNDAAA